MLGGVARQQGRCWLNGEPGRGMPRRAAGSHHIGEGDPEPTPDPLHQAGDPTPRSV